ncbi:MAG: protein phosphatase [Boseongicola sp.]|nr:protein phosphatase [Boseongicola sp.]
MAEYMIAELPLGHGMIGIAPMPGRGGNCSRDLATIVSWGADVVLTMTGRHELEFAGASAMCEDLEAVGVLWRHLPVTDLGAPSPETCALWLEASEVAHRTLDGGGRVLAHCFGGCGRSGMALLRLMVEAGEDVDAALAQLRSVRPCAVETAAQRAWAALGSDRE